MEGWPAGAYGGKQHLPSGLFAPIDIDKQRQVCPYRTRYNVSNLILQWTQIARRTYLPEDYETWLFETSKKAAPRKPRAPVSETPYLSTRRRLKQLHSRGQNLKGQPRRLYPRNESLKPTAARRYRPAFGRYFGPELMIWHVHRKHKRQKREDEDATDGEEDSEPEVVQPRERAAGKRQIKSIQVSISLTASTPRLV